MRAMRNLRRSYLAAVVLVVGIAASASAQEQDQGYGANPASQQQSGPGTSDPGSNVDSAPVDPETSGPVRMARISFLSGSVTWRPDPQTEWANATDNIPLREGAEIWVGDGGRAELQFDDGSYVRLGSGAVANLQTLFSDAQGEYTEIKLTDGLATMELRTDHSVYQIDTPNGAIRSTGPSNVRVGVDEDVEIGVRQGSAQLERAEGKLELHANDYIDLQSKVSNPTIMQLPAEDSWDKFNEERSAAMSHPDARLPENMKSVGGDLNNYGSWREDSEYGNVWRPEQGDEWRPYQDGHWVWCDPFGWTWVGAEQWGWLPYHYGSWIHRPYGWAWVPGPAYQYWSPAVVDFTSVDDNVCWAPLAPFECHYPVAFGLGVWGPHWGSYFSIGFCGVWSPFGATFCYERPWNNHWLNRFHGGYGGFHGGYDHPGLGHYPRIDSVAASRFHPANAGFGTISSSRDGFGAGGRYTPLAARGGVEAFARGGSLGPTRGGLVSGPVNVARPTANSWSGSHSMTTRPEQTGILNRNVYRGSTGYGSSRSGPNGSDAARQARESLGWNSRGGSYSGRPTSSQYSGARTPVQSGVRSSSRGNWSVPDRGGWSHVHSGGGSSAPRNSGGSSGGGGGRGH